MGIMKCSNTSTGEDLGYLSTWDAYVSIVNDPKSDQVAHVSWAQKGTHTTLSKDTAPDDRWLGGKDGSAAEWGLGKNYDYVTYDKGTGIIGIEGTNAELYWDGKYVNWGARNSNTISCVLEADEA
jgi:hypothetical protein